jgi:hypothetical protein
MGGLGIFFSFEGFSAPKHHTKGGEDPHVYGLIFGNSGFGGESVVD